MPMTTPGTPCPASPRTGFLLAVCLLAPACAWAAAPARAPAAAGDPDFAVLPLEAARPGPLPPLAYTVEAGLGLLAPLDEDVEAIYGGIPVAQFRLGVWPSERLVYYVGAGYGRSRGDPWYGEPTFVTGAQAELVVVPLEMGLRCDLAPRPDLRLNLDFQFSLAWTRETLPGVSGPGLEQSRRDSGWLRGLGVGFGPEWPSRDGRRAVGFEAGLTASGGTLGGPYGRDSNLSGVWARVYATLRI